MLGMKMSMKIFKSFLIGVGKERVDWLPVRLPRVASTSHNTGQKTPSMSKYIKMLGMKILKSILIDAGKGKVDWLPRVATTSHNKGQKTPSMSKLDNTIGV